jgi:hypothetical protein
LQVIDEAGYNLYKTSFPTRPFAIKRALLIRNIIAHPSVIMRKEAILKAGMYRPKFDGAEDYDLWLRISRLGKIGNMNENLTYYRVNQFQETIKNKTRQTTLDAEVRNANLTHFISFFSKKSAFCINNGIALEGLRRFKYLITGFLIQPITFLEFVFYIVFPRITKK